MRTWRTPAWILSAALVVLAVWMVVTPKIGSATLAEVRAHAAPELLLPLPHPEGGIQRYEAVEQTLDALFAGRHPLLPDFRAKPLDLQDPQVRRVIAVFEAGPLDRSAAAEDNRTSFIAFTRGLTAAALAAAGQHDWERVRRQMDAAWLVLDRLTTSDVMLADSSYTMAVETTVYKAVLELASRHDLPAALAEHWSGLQSVERHSQEQVRQFLRGEFQLRWLKIIPEFRVSDNPVDRAWVGLGTYDPIETTTLISDRLVELGSNAGLPASRRSSAAGDRIDKLQGPWRLRSRNLWSELAWALTYRVLMNNAPNTLGRMLVSVDYARSPMTRILQAQTRREQVAAALAVARFRQRKGRDPRSFDELIKAGLLQATPMDHAKEQPLAFDLQALFTWPEPARRPTRKRN